MNVISISNHKFEEGTLWVQDAGGNFGLLTSALSFVPDLQGQGLFSTGWGKIQHPGGSHPILQQAEMPPVSNAVCQEKLKKSSSK